MLKKLAFSGAVLTAFAGLALATPAQADTWPNSTKQNVAQQNGNITVCGNIGTGERPTIAAPPAPITFRDNESVSCTNTVDQD